MTRLRYFIAVARCKSFSDAAKRLYTAQPNVSKQIAQLEQELGYAVFTRNKRSVQLTPAGQFLFDSLEGLPDRMDAILEHAANIAKRSTGRLMIGILEGQEVTDVVRQRFRTISQVYPHVEVNLECNSFRNLRTGLQSGYYDVIITMDFDVQGMEGVRTVPFFSQLPAIAINSDNPKAARDTLSLGELADEDFVVISQEESPGGYRIFINQCREAGFTPRVVHKPTSLESLILCVELGKGVALLDQNTRLEKSDRVRTVPIPGAPMRFSAVCMEADDRPVVRNVMHILGGED